MLFPSKRRATKTVMLVSVACGLVPSLLHAQPYHHHRVIAAIHGRGDLGYAHPAYANGYPAPGALIAAATVRAQHEPGVTLELAPDAKETATGGPVGGVPGFDGF